MKKRIGFVLLLLLIGFGVKIYLFLIQVPLQKIDNLPSHRLAIGSKTLETLNDVREDGSKTSVAFICGSEFETVTARIAKIAGVPFVLNNNLSTFHGKLAYIDLTSLPLQWFNSEHVAMLKRFVEQGGHLIMVGVNHDLASRITPLLEKRSLVSSRNHKSFKIAQKQWEHYLEDPKERAYKLSTLEDEGPYSTSITSQKGDAVLAVYEDDTIASMIYSLGNGKLTLIGISPYDLRYRNLVGRDYNANQHYCNGFESLSDLLPLLIKENYENLYIRGLTLHTAPNGYQSTLILTHDIDYTYSIEEGMKQFAQLELRYHTPSTYFIQTKYLTDDKDKAFFTQKSSALLPWLRQNGFEIGSHTVMHTKNFNKLPHGTCQESYPSYRPISFNDKVDRNNPTVCGELKVSKELLIGAKAGETVSFRSGSLLYNKHLPDVMELLGFKQGSNFSAEDVLSYFPYRYPYDEYKANYESNIFEFPLSYEDEEFPPLIFRLNKALELFQIIHHNGAVFVMLIHPDRTWWKLKNFDLNFEENFLKALPSDVWRTTMSKAGDFWRFRDSLNWRYDINNNHLVLEINSDKTYQGITFMLNSSFHLKLIDGENITIKNGKLIVNLHKGLNRWEFITD